MATKDPYIGSIELWPLTWAPSGWSICDGSLLSVSSYPSLFSLIGTRFGGDGRTTFAVPDLRGRVPVGAGTGPGLSPYTTGTIGGQETVTLNQTQLPSHVHGTVNQLTATLAASSKNADTRDPGPAAALARTEHGTYMQTAEGNTDTSVGGLSVGGDVAVEAAGGNGYHENRQPYLALNYIIAFEGILPPRQ